MTSFDLDASERDWLRRGKTDVGLWAYHGLGVKLHDKQLEFIDALRTEAAKFYILWWANRVGKTLGVMVSELHEIYYKPQIPAATTQNDLALWLNEDYRLLHCAPLGTLTTVGWEMTNELTKGTHPAQRDEDGNRRTAALAGSFAATTERDAHGATHMVVKSTNGGTIDFRSTEGGAGRLEGRAWRRITWDEWPQQEAADKSAAIRTVLTRLLNRASDFDAKIMLTGTITEDTEHIAKEFIEWALDESETDWWGSMATRLDNPSASRAAIIQAERSMDAEDYARTVMGRPGGVRGRLFPSFMVDPTFDRALPRFSPPHEQDGATFVPRQVEVPVIRSQRRDDDSETETRTVRGSFRPRGEGSPWTYLHIWDLAIAEAANIGHVWRVPADWRFGWRDVDGIRTLIPIVGVKRVEVPGSRTLTSAEIVHTIEETFLPYGGRIIVDATDAHGKNIERELRRAGYPVDGFGFQERDERGVVRKDRAIENTRKLLTEGMAFLRDKKGEVVESDEAPLPDPEVPYGVLRLPAEWRKARDQLSILRVDNDKQTKDEAMVVLMGCDTAYRTRRSRTRGVTQQRFAVFGGGRSLRG